MNSYVHCHRPFWYNFVVTKYLNQCNAIQPSFQFPLNFVYEDSIPDDDPSRTVKEVVERVNLLKYFDFSHRSSHGFDRLKMLECVLLAFSINGYTSLRDLEKCCRYDIRFQFIMDGQTPSHMAFHRFIHDDLNMPIEEIFYDLNRYFEKHDSIDTDILYIDGTKFEANANKMTFVWMRATKKFREKRWIKIMKRLESLNRYCKKEGLPYRFSILKEFSFEYLVEITETLDKIMKLKHIEQHHGRGHVKHPLQRYKEGFEEDAEKILKYSSYYKLAKGRNSFSKTDPDATFMHMKYDYYNHTNVFKPGYNVQMGSSNGYIRHIYVSSDANDLNTYIPFMESYQKAYGSYPEKTPADAGYGSYDNYSYCKEHGIELYMKYSTMRKEDDKITDKNRFKSYMMKRDEEGRIYCPQGHAFTLEQTKESTKGRYPRTIKFYRNEHCEDCPLRSQCTRSKNGRTLQITDKLIELQSEAKENLSTEIGKELMKQRSIQAEGIFGQIKQDQEYDRLWRRKETMVKLELLLVSIGHNLRKYHTHKMKKQKHQQN